MGNSSSTSNKSAKKEFENFYELVDYIATNYILTMDFKSLTKLSEREYCDKLVILSSDIINKNFTDLEVTYLMDRVENGSQPSQTRQPESLVPNSNKPPESNLKPESSVEPESNVVRPESNVVRPESNVVRPESNVGPESNVVKPESNVVKPESNVVRPESNVVRPESYKPPASETTSNLNSQESYVPSTPIPPESVRTKTENLVFTDKTKLDTVSKDKKRYKCIGIAKYYVKIAHVFAAIVTTISPVFRYKDGESGKMVETGFLDKDKIPKNVSRNLYKLNICDNRINSLKRGHKFVKAGDKDAVVYPKICSFNYNKSGILKTLSDEPGIKELAQLYYDDKYSYTDGTFSGMSTETEAQYYSDLKEFYVAFTGEESMPPTIKTFSDIKLRDYNTRPGCKLQSGEKTPLYNKLYYISRDNELFKEYGTNIKSMIQDAADKQQELLSVIDKLFFIEPGDDKVRIHPKLTDQILKTVVLKTRKIIMELYIKCESDYVNGLKIYEAIVESKIRQTTQNQVITLQNEANKKIHDTMNLTNSLETPTRAVQPPPKSEKNIQPPPPSYNKGVVTRAVQPTSYNQDDMYLSEPPDLSQQAAGTKRR